jgi:membrane-bound lytic murein transglycosylase D
MFKKLLVLSVMMFLLSNCVHKPINTEQELAEGDKIQVPLAQPEEVESFRVTDPEPPKVVDEELEKIPTEVNAKVEQWLNYFQGRGRKHMERYLARSTRYMKVMKNILRKNGLPEDLIYIALIESGFSSRATSHAAAVGYWQFIRGTGKRYGLEINAFVDERRDPILSTQAAAEYFKGLYSVFGSWYLAMASYNVGENRVKKEVMRNYTRDFWELAHKKRLPKETINYIPKFLAAKMIGNDPAKYGFTEIEYEKPLEFELIKVHRPVNLKQMAEKMNFDYDELKQLNPKFKGEIAPTKVSDSGEHLELRVPIGQTQVALNAAQQSFVDKLEFIADAGDTQIHRVKKGESLYSIARKYKTNVAFLRNLNDLKSGRKLRIGMRLQVPERGSKPVKYVAKNENKKPQKAPEKSEQNEIQEKATESIEVVTKDGTFYIVQAGDTLSEIADEYDSTINELRKLNNLKKGRVLKVGMKLKVPKVDKGIPATPDTDEVIPSRGPQALESFTHIVRAGENLNSIAQRYGISIDQLKKVNNLKKKTVLRVGTRLIIPIAKASSGSGAQIKKMQQVKSKSYEKKIAKQKTRKFHVVKRGENLHTISEKFNVELRELRALNQSVKGSKLLIGTRLMIPEAQASR